MSSEAPKKILIVGETLTGKSSLIRVFMEHEGDTHNLKDVALNSAVSQSTNANTMQCSNSSYTNLNRSI